MDSAVTVPNLPIPQTTRAMLKTPRNQWITIETNHRFASFEQEHVFGILVFPTERSIVIPWHAPHKFEYSKLGRSGVQPLLLGYCKASLDPITSFLHTVMDIHKVVRVLYSSKCKNTNALLSFPNGSGVHQKSFSPEELKPQIQQDDYDVERTLMNTSREIIVLYQHCRNIVYIYIYIIIVMERQAWFQYHCRPRLIVHDETCEMAGKKKKKKRLETKRFETNSGFIF
jgi:hypothetical protein